MNNIEEGLRAVSHKTKRILKRRPAGQPLSAEDKDFLDHAAGRPAVATTPPAATAPKKSASLAAAVADLRALGLTITKEDLRQLKRERGTAAGFETSGRVNLDVLLPILRERAAAATPGLRDRQSIDVEIAEERLKELKRKNAVEDGLYIAKLDGAKQAQKFLADVAPTLDQKLVNEWPASWATCGSRRGRGRFYRIGKRRGRGRGRYERRRESRCRQSGCRRHARV